MFPTRNWHFSVVFQVFSCLPVSSAKTELGGGAAGWCRMSMENEGLDPPDPRLDGTTTARPRTTLSI